MIATLRVLARRAERSGLAVLLTLSVLSLSSMAPRDQARADPAVAALAARPQSLPDMALGPEKAAVTIVEYASMSCPHCAAFAEKVLPMLRSKYVDSGKVRFVFREFPLDIKAAAASILARCIAGDDSAKYFATVERLFRQQIALMEQTKTTLLSVGEQGGLGHAAVEACEEDQAMFDKMTADQKFAVDELKVDATPTFFINGEKVKGALTFEEIDSKLTELLKK